MFAVLLRASASDPALAARLRPVIWALLLAHLLAGAQRRGGPAPPGARSLRPACRDAVWPRTGPSPAAAHAADSHSGDGDRVADAHRRGADGAGVDAEERLVVAREPA